MNCDNTVESFDELWFALYICSHPVAERRKSPFFLFRIPFVMSLVFF